MLRIKPKERPEPNTFPCLPKESVPCVMIVRGVEKIPDLNAINP
jgi:hypothetical protein